MKERSFLLWPVLTGLCLTLVVPGHAQDMSSIPIYRSYNADADDHLFSRSPDEGIDSGYEPEGVAFHAFRNGSDTRVPFFRCVDPSAQEHFLSLDPDCDGARLEGRLGFLETEEFGYDTALYACGKGSETRVNFVTRSNRECVRGGLIREGVLGYAAQ